jgi:two-component system CheB/CheR fusion protein
MLAKVFDLFTQVDHSLDRAQGGLGVGLTLVKSLVEMHGGSVEAHSDGPGTGSEFVIRLPLSPARIEDRESKREDREAGNGDPRSSILGDPSTPRALRVLVVDDNPDAADSLAMLLRLEGHDVRIARDGRAALEGAQAYLPRVVLLDIGLPGLDGYSVARHLREQPGTRDALLVAISGYGQEEDRQRSRQAGFDHHLVKPIDFSELQQVMPALPAAVSAARPAPLGN